MAEETGTDWYNISKESMKAQLGVGEKYKQKTWKLLLILFKLK